MSRGLSMFFKAETRLSIFVLCLMVFSVAYGKAVCFGRVSDTGKCKSWRYMDADYFGRPRVEKTTLSDGKNGYAAVLRPAMKKARFMMLTSYFGKAPVIGDNIGVKVTFRLPGNSDGISLYARISTNETSGKLGKLSERKITLSGRKLDNDWCEAIIPTTAFGCKAGAKILRVHIVPEAVNAGDGKVYVSEISIIDSPEVAKIQMASSKPVDTASVPVKRKRYCAIFPKPFWYTDTNTFYAPRVYKELHRDGFNVIGVPGTSMYSLPKDLAARVKRFVNTGREIAKYPGMQAYPKMTMCWKFPQGGEHYDRMVWFNGYRQQLVCPADERYWNERVIPYCTAYAQASLQVPVFAIMLDWEIYPVGKKFRGIYGACYCDSCWRRFLREAGRKGPTPPLDKRNQWLMDHDLRFKYSKIFYQHLSSLGTRLRKSTDKINPRLSYWFIPNVGDTFTTTLARALATPAAPIVVSDEGSYGKPSLALSDAEGIKANVALVKNDLEYLRKTKIPFLYLAAIMGDQRPGYHGQQALAMAELCDGIWLWELSKVEHYKYGRDNLMNVLRDANREIKQGTFKLTTSWRQTSGDAEIDIPFGKYGIGLSGINAREFVWPHNSCVMEMSTLSPGVLKKFRLVILQNFNAELAADSPTVRALRQFVHDGGRLLLTHDTGFFMSSPFPEIVRGALVPPEKGDIRHILDVKMQIAKKCFEAPAFAGKTFDASFNDHTVFKPGDKGRVLVSDRYNYPVIIAGNYGKGKVIFSGSYYKKMKKDEIETKFIQSLIEWLWK